MNTIDQYMLTGCWRHIPRFSAGVARRPGGKNRVGRVRAGFSMVEILTSIFVLGTGLLMVAGVFPVGIKWTNQDAHNTVAQIIASNAVQILETQYSGTTPPAVVGPFPYAYGTDHPFVVQGPAAKPGNALYYWTAYFAPIPSAGGASATNQTYRVSIFVFNNPDPTAVYPVTQVGGGGIPLTTGASASYPQLFYGLFDTVAQNQSGNSNPMPVDSLGVEMATGSAFRTIIDPQTNSITMNDQPVGTTPPDSYVIYAPAAIGQSVSPLVYVYETTVSL